MITQKRLKELLAYDPDSGLFIGGNMKQISKLLAAAAIQHAQQHVEIEP